MKSRARTPTARMSLKPSGGRTTPGIRQSVARIGVENLIPESVMLQEQGAFNTTHKIARTPVKRLAPSPAAKPAIVARSPFADRSNQKSPARAKSPFSTKIDVQKSPARAKISMSPAVAGRVKKDTAASVVIPPPPLIVRSSSLPTPLSASQKNSMSSASVAKKSISVQSSLDDALTVPSVIRRVRNDDTVVEVATPQQQSNVPAPFREDKLIGLDSEECTMAHEVNDILNNSSASRPVSTMPTPAAPSAAPARKNAPRSAPKVTAAPAPFSPLAEQMQVFDESEEFELELEHSIDTSISFIEQILERKLAPDEFRRLAREMRSPAVAGASLSTDVLETIQKRRISYGICSMTADNAVAALTDGRKKSLRKSIVPEATATVSGAVSTSTPIHNQTESHSRRQSISGHSPSCTEVIDELKSVLSAFMAPNTSTSDSAVKTPAPSSTLFKVSYKLRGFQGATSPIPRDVLVSAPEVSTSVVKSTNKSPAQKKASRKSTVLLQEAGTAALNLVATATQATAQSTIIEEPEEDIFVPKRTLQRSPEAVVPAFSPRPSKAVLSSEMLATLQSKLDGVVQSLPVFNRRHSNVTAAGMAATTATPLVNGDAFIEEIVKNSPIIDANANANASLEDEIMQNLMACVSTTTLSPKPPIGTSTRTATPREGKSPKQVQSATRSVSRSAKVQYSPPGLSIASPVPVQSASMGDKKLSPQQQHDVVEGIMKKFSPKTQAQTEVIDGPVMVATVTANEERLTQRLQQLEEQLCSSLESFDQFKAQSQEQISSLKQAKLDAELSVCRENLDKLSAAQFILEQKELLREERRARMRAEVAIALLSTRLTESIERISDLVAGKQATAPVATVTAVAADASPEQDNIAAQPSIESSPTPAEVITPSACCDDDYNADDVDYDDYPTAGAIQSVSKSLFSQFDESKPCTINVKKVAVHTRFSDNSELQSTYDIPDDNCYNDDAENYGVNHDEMEIIGTEEDHRIIKFAMESAQKAMNTPTGSLLGGKAKLPKKGTPFHGVKKSTSNAVPKATNNNAGLTVTAEPKDPLSLKYAGGLSNLRFIPLTKKVKTVKPLGDGWMDNSESNEAISSSSSPIGSFDDNDNSSLSPAQARELVEEQQREQQNKKKRKAKALPAAKVSRAAFSPIAKASRGKYTEPEEELQEEQESVPEAETVEVQPSPERTQKTKGKKSKKTLVVVTEPVAVVNPEPVEEKVVKPVVAAVTGKRKKPSRSQEASNLKLVPLKTKTKLGTKTNSADDLTNAAATTTTASVIASVSTGRTLTLADQLSGVEEGPNPEDIFSPAKSPPLKRATKNSRKQQVASPTPALVGEAESEKVIETVDETVDVHTAKSSKTKSHKPTRKGKKTAVSTLVPLDAADADIVVPEVASPTVVKISASVRAVEPSAAIEAPLISEKKARVAKSNKSKARGKTATKVAAEQVIPAEAAVAPATVMQNISSISLKDTSAILDDDKSFDVQLRARSSMASMSQSLRPSLMSNGSILGLGKGKKSIVIPKLKKK